MTEETDQELNKKLLTSILARLETVEKKNEQLEAENKALKEAKEVSQDPIKQMVLEAKRKEEENKIIADIRKNYDLGDIIRFSIRKNLISRQGSSREE